MLHALLPAEVRPEAPVVPVAEVATDGVGAEVDLSSVGFYVPPYMGPPATLDLIRALPNLQVVQLLTAGYEAALRVVPPHVTLCNAAGVHDASTAELAVGLILASLRGIDDFARAMPAGTWRYERRDSLADRRVLVIGAGGVGRAIGARLRPFEVEVVVVGRSAREGVRGASDLPALLPWADVVVLCVPLDPQTTALADDRFLARMRDGALLVNVARGPVVHTDALLDHVGRGRIRVAMDVTEPEPLPPGHPLWRMPGVLISPHVGGNTSAFLPRARRLVAEQVGRWSRGEPLLAVVGR
ncbi:MAG: 2-hydroxyacid dehydrogenase [Candidatus Nanopelagicales bacterium]